MIFRIIIWSILLTLIVRFVLRFVLPVFQITRATQSKIRDMQRQMEEMQEQKAGKSNNNQQVKEGDYIDYEEVK